MPVSLALFGLVVLSYFSSVTNDFVNFDDPIYITANPFVQQGFTSDALRWAFTTFEGGFWHPLTWLSIMLDCRLFGATPGPHHAVSMLLHAVNTVLVFLLFRKMSGAVWRSAFVAVLFGIHPLHVESVAWASERKDVLSTFFWVLSLWFYVAFAMSRAEANRGTQKRDRRPAFYAASLAFFILGLMTKSMVVTLPVLLLLLDGWPLQRLRLGALRPQWPVLGEKIPFFALALIFGLVTIRAQHTVEALPTASQFPIWARLANAALSYATYLRQAFIPIDLAVYYPYPTSFSRSMGIKACRR